MYSCFAQYYDCLTDDVDYNKKTAHLLKLFKKYGKTPTLLLDLACGTGGFSNCFAQNGVEVIGVDMSEEMLGLARENSAEMELDVLYLCQKAQELDLYGTVDGAVCCLDSLNHITNYKDFCKAIEKVSLFLEKDCLFIFDLNTEYKHREILGDNVFVIENDDVYCVWANKYKEKTATVEVLLDFFVKSGDSYYRESEQFTEKAYTNEQVKTACEKAGLEILEIFDDYTLKPLNDKSQRAVVVARKVK